MKKHYFVVQASLLGLAARGKSISQFMSQGFARPGLSLLCISLWITLMLQSTLTTAQCTNVTLSNQTQVDNFPSRGCITITGNLIISGSTITNLNGLSSLNRVTGDLRIINNASLTSVAGLSGLTSTGFDLRITNNALLPNLTGISSLTNVGGDLLIQNNSQLTSVAGLSRLTRVGANLRITDNAILPNLTGLSSLTSVGGEEAGDLRINSNPQLISVAGLSGLTRIGFDLQILDNAILPNLDGLSNLTSIGGDLRIQTNPQLISVAGLNGLTRVSFSVRISGNTLLPNLDGLNNLTSVGGEDGGDLLIQNNPKLINVAGLSGVTSIGFDLQITGNTLLTSLTGFSSLTSIGGDLRIQTNPQLSGCAIEPICQLLANRPGSVTISGNATGCNSVAQIQVDCTPLFITQPPASSSLVCVGTPVSTSVGVSGNARAYQWYKDGLSLGAAQQSSTLTLPSVQASDAGTYQVVVSNSVTSLTSAAFSLTVNPYPTASLAAEG